MPDLISPQCDLTTLYVLVDDAVNEMDDKPRKIGRPSLLSDSEMITILVWNTLVLHQKNLKDILNFIKNYHPNDFKKLPRYSGFVAHAQRVLPRMFCLLSLSLAKSEINFVDSTMLEVYKLFRADSHKVAQDLAKFGKNHQGWHYGFKLHGAINIQGAFTSFCFSSAEVYDAQILPKLVDDFMKILVGDSHYGVSVMRKYIWDNHGIIIIAPPHFKQKTKIAALWQNALLNFRSKIKSVL